MDRFVDFCQKDPLVQKIIHPISKNYKPDVDSWIKSIEESEGRINFPESLDEELYLSPTSSYFFADVGIPGACQILWSLLILRQGFFSVVVSP